MTAPVSLCGNMSPTRSAGLTLGFDSSMLVIAGTPMAVPCSVAGISPPRTALPRRQHPPHADGVSVLCWEMDRETLEKDLTQAEAHVAKGHERIALQHEIIAELEREGHDTVPARELLATFEKTQAMHVANRDRIASKLAALD
jgi:hypothetical protein